MGINNGQTESDDLEQHLKITTSDSGDEIMEAALQVASNAGLTGTNKLSFAIGYLSAYIADNND